MISAYLEFVGTPTGTIVLVLASLLICIAVVYRVWGGHHWERLPALVAAGTLTMLILLVYGIAVAAGWWGGAYFRTPPIVQVATLVPMSLIGWVGWLLGYGWLSSHSRHPLQIYLLGSLLLVFLVVLADRAELSRGTILIADDGKIWVEAVIGAILMLAPVLLFETVRRAVARDALP